MVRFIIGIVSVLAVAWWKRKVIQAFYEGWFARNVEIIVETTSGERDQASPEAAEEEDASEAVSPDEVTVYITAAGTRYHRAGCQSVTEDAESITLSDVPDQYKPCGRCKPPA